MFPCSPLISPLSLYSLPLLSPLSHSLPLLLPLSPSLSKSPPKWTRQMAAHYELSEAHCFFIHCLSFCMMKMCIFVHLSSVCE